MRPPVPFARIPRALPLALLLALGFTLGCEAQGPGAAASSQSSGLLVGLKVPQNPKARPFTPARYRTLWIAPADGAVRVAAQGAGIVVPRKDGFWRVEVRTSVCKCYGGQYDCVYQVVDADPATKPPRPTSRRAADAEAADEEVDDCDAFSDVEPNAEELLFVGTDYLATDEFTMGRRVGRYYSVQSVEDLGSFAGIKDVLRKPAADVFDATVRRVVDSMRTEGEPIVSTRWAVTRGAGRWTLQGQATVATEECSACGYAHARFELALAPPRSLVGHDALSPAWAVIAHKVPGLRDALASPSRDLLVTLTAKSLQVFSVRNGAIGEALLTVPLAAPKESVVMGQWATGQHVERWTRELTAILKP
jgi:hypothetical protein